MQQCTRCDSYAINPRLHGRDGGDADLCDVCYWRKRAEASELDCQVCETAANRLEHLQTVLRQLIAATELHHLNPMDLENRSKYNQAKRMAKQAIGLDT